jgi:glycosyltransferase involved in cell wall biosynthesis
MSGTHPLVSLTSHAGPQRIGILIKSMILGGAQRMVLDLCRGLKALGHPVDLLLVKKGGPLLPEIPPGVTIVEVKPAPRIRAWPLLLRLPGATRRILLPLLASGGLPDVIRSLPSIVRYLEHARPAALLATLPQNNLAALWAGHLARGGSRTVIREAITFSIDSASLSGPFDRRLVPLARQWYRQADGIVAVSQGVADDLIACLDLPADRVTTIYNPVDEDRVARLAQLQPDEPWLRDGEPPVVLAVGRLYPQKDYPTLLRAFARLVTDRDARLIILGEGPDRPALEALSRELGISDRMRMPGEDPNPFAYMGRSKVFVLSSLWEGFPNVIVQALVCGCAVVSTDCPSGPVEILEAGRWGRLVPMGDPEALSHGIAQAFDEPRSHGEGAAAMARRFGLAATTERYLDLLLG